MVYGLLGASLILTLLTPPFILRMYWHSPCHNLLAYRVPIVGIFWGTGGVLRVCRRRLFPPRYKKESF